jgi:hypothetical protein
MATQKKAYEPKMRYEPLDMHVLAVAVEGRVKDWAAYIGAVEGYNHDLEYKRVSERGTKLPYNIAKLLFPDFDNRLAWRP